MKGKEAMTTIKATCGRCGDVELTVADVHVMINADHLSASYSFRCTKCAQVVVKTAPGPTIDLLVSAGVTYSVWRTPRDTRPDPEAPLFDHGDMVEFTKMLGNDRAVATALADLRGLSH